MSGPRYRYYLLDDAGEVIGTDDVETWAAWFEQSARTQQRVVKQDFVEGAEGRVGVSTVFLALDHNWTGTGPPVLWETLVFGTALDGEMKRYRSKVAALRGHETLLQRVSEQWRQEQS